MSFTDPADLCTCWKAVSYTCPVCLWHEAREGPWPCSECGRDTGALDAEVCDECLEEDADALHALEGPDPTTAPLPEKAQ